MKNIKLFEAFAGIGSQHQALKNIGCKVEVVGLAEWFIPAIKAYVDLHQSENDKLINNETPNSYYDSLSKDSKKPAKNLKLDDDEKNKIDYAYKFFNNYADISKIEKLNFETDIFTYSFPCQDLSQQGKQKGMSKDSGTRSGLLWEVERILKNTDDANKPKFLLMENVEAIINKNNIKEFHQWIKALDELGYHSEYKLLNAANFGTAQNRKRVFMISWKKEIPFKFDLGQKFYPDVKICDILEDENKKFWIPKKTYESTEFKINYKNKMMKRKLLNYTNFNSENQIYYSVGTGPTLTASGANSRFKIETSSGDIRIFNGIESLKYMGFKKNDILKIKGLNDNQLVFLAGNSICVPVLESIFENITKFLGQ